MIFAENNFYQSIIVTQLLQSLQFQLLIEHPWRAYTGYAPHIIRNVPANVFSLRRFGIFFCRNVRRHVFAQTSGIPTELARQTSRTVPETRV